ncbi:MAG: leucyl aminopeptidase family protein [Inquilinus sp.]|nr:leucyl aminopeptidase family protein [Inquilinus sp.]
MRYLTDQEPTDTVPIETVTAAGLDSWLAGRDDRLRAWIADTGFAGKPGERALLPGPEGRLAGIAVGVDEDDGLWRYAGLPEALPPGTYRLDGVDDPAAATQGALGWALGCYRFDRYTAREREPARLVWPAAADRAAVERAATATGLVRDLVNTPAGDMGPAELAAAAAQLAGEFEASVVVIAGDDLLPNNYPTIHAVGRGSARAPRLIDIAWGDPAAPKVTIVGKGVCFDSGGLDLKPSNNMLLMKKDMGGGAHALGLARMIMQAGLPVRLRVLVPAVENMVSGDSFKPLDVIRTRKGLTVEVGNTDAEGRLVLCDALAEAADQEPALIVDFATLTGAARVALGPDLPALFCNDEATASALLAAGEREADPMWRLPLWKPYAKSLRSPVADTNNIGDSPFAGSITAALFLEKFVPAAIPWVHLDLFAWNPADRPGRPKGGEAMTIRAVYALIAERFSG